MTSLRQRLREERLTGLFVQTPHPVVAEVAAGLGPDLLCLDQEHAPLGTEAVHALVGAARLGGLATLVRVPAATGHHVAAALDAGADGVLVPHVESAEATAEIVRFSRYPPAGERGLGPSRANAWGRAFGGEDETVVGVQVETRRAVEALDEILAVEGVDLVLVGPGDLALSLGLPGGPADPALRPVVEDVLDRVAAGGKAPAVFAPDPAAGAAWLARGVRLVLVGSDLGFLAGAMQEAWSTLRG